VRTRRRAWVGALLLALVFVAPVPFVVHHPPAVHAATPYIDPTFNVDVQRDIVYGSAVNVDGVDVTLTLDLYTPRGDVSTKRPVFVFAHGGFFAFGDKSEGSSWGNRLAQRGYVVASINYRLSSTLVVAPVDSDRELQEINDARTDMQTAVRWVRANAASLRIDADKIAVGGVSAGAVTALGVAVNNDDPEVALYPGESSAV
jgi:carboxylesterase type B